MLVNVSSRIDSRIIYLSSGEYGLFYLYSSATALEFCVYECMCACVYVINKQTSRLSDNDLSSVNFWQKHMSYKPPISHIQKYNFASKFENKPRWIMRESIPNYF